MQKDRNIRSDDDLASFADKVIEIAKTKITPELARNQFRHCNICV